LRDQLADRLAGPQREWQLQLIWAPADDQPPDHGFLAPVQGLLLARAPTALTAGQRGFAGRLEGLHPFSDKATVDPNGLGNLDPALAGEHHVDRYTTEFGLGCGRKFAEITIGWHRNIIRRLLSE
jgi:hypothetical protein